MWQAPRGARCFQRISPHASESRGIRLSSSSGQVQTDPAVVKHNVWVTDELFCARRYTNSEETILLRVRIVSIHIFTEGVLADASDVDVHPAQRTLHNQSEVCKVPGTRSSQERCSTNPAPQQ